MHLIRISCKNIFKDELDIFFALKLLLPSCPFVYIVYKFTGRPQTLNPKVSIFSLFFVIVTIEMI